LTDEDYGGLYHSGKYILRVKTVRHLDEFSPEINFMINFLGTHLDSEKMSYLFNLYIYNDNEDVRPDRDDITIYNDEIEYGLA